jgi:hypothetical protein
MEKGEIELFKRGETMEGFKRQSLAMVVNEEVIAAE